MFDSMWLRSSIHSNDGVWRSISDFRLTHRRQEGFERVKKNCSSLESMASTHAVRSVLRRFPAFMAEHEPDTVLLQSISDGLINATWRVGGGGGFIIQRLHPIFGPEVNDDIAAMTPILRRAGVPVPEIYPADDGRWCVEVAQDRADSEVWRLLGALEGQTIHRVHQPRYARSAAEAIADFHAALDGVAYEFRSVRPGAHDTDAHLAHARATVEGTPNHRLIAPVDRIVDELTDRWSRCPRPPATLPTRIVHGDLKISNLLFSSAGEVSGIIDLDTMARSTLHIELGDMLRSWCNPAGEDATEAVFSEQIFHAATTGYLANAGDWLDEQEVLSWVCGLERIALELAARFAADAIAECYFGWSPQIAPSRGEHNLIRSENQLQLARAVASRRSALQDRLVTSFRSAASS